MHWSNTLHASCGFSSWCIIGPMFSITGESDLHSTPVGRLSLGGAICRRWYMMELPMCSFLILQQRNTGQRFLSTSQKWNDSWKWRYIKVMAAWNGETEISLLRRRLFSLFSAVSWRWSNALEWDYGEYRVRWLYVPFLFIGTLIRRQYKSYRRCWWLQGII